MAHNFNRIARNRVPRSIHDLSHTKTLTCDMGQLIPVMYLEVVPGDVFNISHEVVVRFQPLVAPVLHPVSVYIHSFFVANRLTWASWEDFITGGEDGTSAPTLPLFDPVDKDKGSLWDYLGFPTSASSAMATGIEPVGFPAYAYNEVYNEYYRDQTHITEVAINQSAILNRAWARDYYTSALPWQQRGTAPALPISGTLDVDGKDAAITLKNTADATARIVDTLNAGVAGDRLAMATQPTANGAARWVDPALEVDLSPAVTFDISDLRLATAQQRYLELNARAGARYTEWLKAHFGTGPTDERLDRPEYIGGIRQPVIISPVLQTSATDTGTSSQDPLGTLGGHAVSADTQRVGNYRVQEFGVIISILSVMPTPIYSQGVPRNWIKTTRYDYYDPLFAHLSEQPVLEGEIYAGTVSAENNTIFGYQGRYDELRFERSTFHANMRDTFDYWHLGREFTARPSLNQAFVEAVAGSPPPSGGIRKDIFASSGEDGLIVHIGNRVKAARPIPIISDPGFMDH